jgi:2-keto-4-pentenoate hydratase
MNTRNLTLSLCAVAWLALSGTVAAASKAVDEAADKLARHYLEKQPLAAVPSVVFAQGKPPVVRDAFVDRLDDRLGAPIGYKIGFATAQLQAQFNVAEPAYGVLLHDMLVQTGATLPAGFAINPQIEGDLLVRIGKDSINQAKTREEVLDALDAAYGFIEIPDLMYAPTSKEKYGAPSIIAVNLGARVGVMGAPVPLEKGQAGLDQLGRLKVTLLDSKKQPLAMSSELDAGNTHPLDGLLWLRDKLRADGKALKPGDLISLGTLTPPVPLFDLEAVTARYEGLTPGKPVEVTVGFTPKNAPKK